jgi:hypothetical protein
MNECTNEWKEREWQQNRYLWKPENFSDMVLQNGGKYESEVAVGVSILKLRRPNILN